MSVQTTYDMYYNAAKLGNPFDLNNMRTISRNCESALPFGSAVVAGTDPETQIILPFETGLVFRGIAIAIWTVEQTYSSFNPIVTYGQYPQGMQAAIVTQGIVWVRASQDVLVDDAAFFVFDPTDPTVQGTFRKDDGTTPTADAVPTGVFRSSALEGELVKLEINLP